MITLESYICGQWHTGTGEPRKLYNPSNGEEMGQILTGDIDFTAVLEHARTKGLPALQEMTFGQRGQMLKALSAKLHEHRDELIELSTSNGGNTRGDAKFDIDGATGTLAAYAGVGKQLGDRSFLSDGAGDPLNRSGRFWGQHVLVPRQGVAVHINAFNFPAWGMGEKMACALLAGVPVIEKPGTPSALLAYRMAQITVESGLLPEGAFQFVVGRTGNLLDQLGPQDCVAFTGSSRTGATLKSNENVSTRNVRMNIEADSVNCAVVSPDVERGSDAYNQFVRNVVIDVTQKAGQKCTAVRRILVPENLVDPVVEDLSDRLGEVRVGDPADGETGMGPVASASQLADVREGIQKLMEVGEIICGGPDPVAEAGYFVAPTLLMARDNDADVLHQEEVFGPVATIIKYSGDAADAVELANRGGGALVASLYANDRSWIETVALGISPWHGRVWIGSDKTEGQAMPPGAVLPMSIHGGPGRAGGGEELGGLRGLALYMQCTAVQGYQGVVARAFGEAEG